ncbi:MAG: hypothetical protein OXE94_00515 [Aestuariivita sp.]|nr:hypothetical protein [Aestuariivita sp.]MCY4201651.1 hypothetical protein [Aestuariivita sp.]MCY4287917.1 hypothetical protein [Aestuariivita sp.]MCY4348203.1 hypothetical protein [Aestuariivita sp.]
MTTLFPPNDAQSTAEEDVSVAAGSGRYQLSSLQRRPFSAGLSIGFSGREDDAMSREDGGGHGKYRYYKEGARKLDNLGGLRIPSQTLSRWATKLGQDAR